MIRKRRLRPSCGSHLPVLMTLLDITRGPVVELGSGKWSTTYLHWACFPNRTLVTYEHDRDWYELMKLIRSDWHKFIRAKDWDAIDLSQHWSIALVDNEADRRHPDVMRLHHADFVVAHDADGNYYDNVTGYKYRMRYIGGEPSTLILSNKYNPRNHFLAKYCE